MADEITRMLEKSTAVSFVLDGWTNVTHNYSVVNIIAKIRSGNVKRVTIDTGSHCRESYEPS